jgi:MoaA/NifB/PqqE/SkfB family radical SAM enzyme
MCYLKSPESDSSRIQKELSAREWIYLAQQARDAGMLEVLLTGGEVFLREDFQEIYEEISMLGLFPVIYSNGTLITPEISKWLACRPPRKMEVTLYGASPETYKKVTGCASGYDLAVAGIDNLLAAGINVALRTTVIPDNAEDYEALLQFADSRSCGLKFCHYISPRREERSNEHEIKRLNAHDLRAYMNRASRDFEERWPSRGTDESCVTPSEGQRNVLHESAFPKECEAGVISFWLTWDGSMTPCALMRDPSVQPLRVGFKDSWEQLAQKVKKVPRCVECDACRMKKKCWSCPARLKLETGSYEKPATYFCDLVRSRTDYES